MATSLDVYYPFDGGAGSGIPTESAWRAMFRHVLGTGPLAGEDNEMAATGDSSGMQVKVATGKAWMRGHYGENTSIKTLAIAAVGGIAGGQSRLDRVVLRGDFDDDVIEVAVVTGTAAATGSQVAPALTQSSTIWEVSLATVGPLTNATTTIAAGTVTDTRELVQSFGNSVGVRVTYTPTISGTGWALGNAVVTASYSKVGKIVSDLRVKIVWGSTSTYGPTQPFVVSLPFTAANSLTEYGTGVSVDVSVGTYDLLHVTIDADGATPRAVDVAANGSIWPTTKPKPGGPAWAAGDILAFSVPEYESTT